MTTREIQGEVHRIIAEDLQLDVPQADLDLIDAGLLDSLSFIELMVQLESSFEISIDLQSLDLDHLRSVDAISRFVGREVAGS